jgi:hypothetical protein
LLIAAAHCCKKILHNLDILFDAHCNLSFSLITVRDRSTLLLSLLAPGRA